MLRYLIAAAFLVSTVAMLAVALLQHRDGRLTGTRLALVLGGATSSLVAGGGLALS